MVSVDGYLIGTADEFGTQITLSDEVGWYGSPSMRHPGRADRPGAHGTFASPGLSDGRSIQLNGNGFATDSQAAIRSMRALRAVLSSGAAGALSWFDRDTDMVLSAMVERDGDVQIGWLSDHSFRWQMVLFAPDQRVYGEPQSIPTSLAGGGIGLAMDFGGDLFDSGTLGSSGTVTLVNDGTASTEPQFTVTGPMGAGFTITRLETGEQITYPQPVGDAVVVDCGEGTVTSGGQDRTGLLSHDQFPSIGPGESASFQFSTLGPETYLDPCSMTATVSPAYA
jgi:hypothetical protein